MNWIHGAWIYAFIFLWVTQEGSGADYFGKRLRGLRKKFRNKHINGYNGYNTIFHRRFERPVRKVRVYYIAAVEVDWDYAPQGNVLGDKSEPYTERFFSVSRKPVRLGKVYRKAIFREFTDETYTVMKSREAWQGILGPTIRGETGDLAIVHFLNNASMPLSMHPHGARYIKVHEGALYEDGTGEPDKIDDRVPPGMKHTYNWYFIPKDGPTESDPDCLTWMYHSHRNADTDIHAGLLGPIIVCRPGTLDERDKPKNVDRSFVLVFLIFDENDSFYIDENIERIAPNLSEEERERLKRNMDFRRSNMMFSINGLGFGNLRGVEMCLGDKVGLHMVGMGNEVDVHSISFEGQVYTYNGRTTDIISLFPAKFTTSLMIPSRDGTFPFVCEVGIHGNAGMEATFTVNVCPSSRPMQPKLTGILREHYVAVEEIDWHYAPSGINRFNGMRLQDDKYASMFFRHNATRIGGEYKKAVYREYRDATFVTPKMRGFEEAHWALMGPTIRGEVGDLIRIILHNRASRPYNIQTHGAYYAPDNIPVMPGETRIYNWAVAEQYGPTPVDPQCITYRYYSRVDVTRDVFDGLSGVLLICKPGTLDKHGKQKNIDREFSLMFSVMDENESHFLQENTYQYLPRPSMVNVSDPWFVRSNQMHSINGRSYGNLEGLSMCLGETVSWHLFTFGRAIDLHTAYFHGQTFQQSGRFKDTLSLVPSSHYTVVMHADNPGDWALDCRTNDHFASGMRAIFRVDDCGGTFGTPHHEIFPKPRKIREYFIAAVEEDWNYAPTDRHVIDGSDLLKQEESRFYVEQGPNRIGRVYKKALYREFTDASFRFMKKRGRDEEHLAVLGPFIRAEVGETIRVVFKNLASRPYNIHPHGVLLEKLNELNFKDHLDEDEPPVPPGEMVVYEWPVPERAGPGRNGFNCTTWAYYSTVDVVKDTNAGLIGPLVTCKPGILSSTGHRTDVDHEFAVLFTIFDENRSWYIRDNIQRFTTRPSTVNPTDRIFMMTNRMHAVNGRIYGSLHGLVARRNSHAAWYLIGMGTEVDMHTAHFHGQTFLKRSDSSRRADVVYLFPGVFETIEMFMDNPGTWFLHCHVDDHMRAGMAVTYTVQR